MGEQSSYAEAQFKTSAKTNVRRASLRKKLIVILLLLIALPIAWRWTPLNEWISFGSVIEWQLSVKHQPGAFFWVVGAYLLGSLVLFPVTILNVATVFTFGPLLGNVYGLAGWLASAAMGYGMGRAVGRDLVHKMVGPRLHRLIHQAGRHGFLTVLIMRLLPVAPFTAVNMFVGASGIRFWDFCLASLVGRIPGIVILTLAGFQMASLLRSPAVEGFVLLAIIVGLIPIASQWLFRRWVSAGTRERNAGR
jgi:uncharacterized membrane protein YdjX (TVP38/TMEM64 family)